MKYINHTDSPSKMVSDINDNFNDLGSVRIGGSDATQKVYLPPLLLTPAVETPVVVETNTTQITFLFDAETTGRVKVDGVWYDLAEAEEVNFPVKSPTDIVVVNNNLTEVSCSPWVLLKLSPAE